MLEYLYRLILVVILIAPGIVYSKESIIDCQDVKNDELYCMACNVYHESRGEGESGMEAVAWVMLNRLHDPRFPSNMCDIVWEMSNDTAQFSWVNDEFTDGVKNLTKWSESLTISHDILLINELDLPVYDDPTAGATYYKKVGKISGWWKSLEQTSKIGNHHFFMDYDSNTEGLVVK